MAELDTLAHLQDLDTQIDERQHRLEAIKASLGVSAQLKQARGELEQAVASLQRLEKRQRDLEWDMSDRSSKIAALETKLYSGTVRSPKDLSALQAEIEHMKVALSGVEDQALETMGQVDQARASTVERERELGQLQTRWSADQQALRQEGKALTETLAGLRAQRESTAAGVGKPLLARYEELRRSRRGLAVSRLDRGVCLGCRTSLPTAQVQSARQGQVVYCSSCGRILYAGR
jgi:predicted  nucleic acid-binding Zn-ribbon protein